MNKFRLNNLIKLLVMISSNKNIVNIKDEIKGLLVLLEISLNNTINKIISLRTVMLTDNKRRLLNINHIGDNSIILYNFNKNELLRKTIISKLTIGLIESLFTGIKLFSKDTVTNYIIISKPVIKENLDNINIKFYYYLPLYKMNTWISRVNKYINLITVNSLHSDDIKLNLINNIIQLKHGNSIKKLDINYTNDNTVSLLLNEYKSTPGISLDLPSKLNIITNNIISINESNTMISPNVQDIINQLNTVSNNNNITSTAHYINNSNISSTANPMILSSIDKLLNNLNNNDLIQNNSIKLSTILTKFYNKNVVINVTQLKYEANNSDILLKVLSESIGVKTSLSKVLKYKLENRFILYNEKALLKQSLINSKLNTLSKNLKYNKLNQLITTNIFNINKDTYSNLLNYIDSSTVLSNDLQYKYLIGWNFNMKGKIGNGNKKDRTQKLLLKDGSFKNIINNDILNTKLRLNYLNNSTMHSYLSKNTNIGKIGLQITLNVI